MNSKPTAQAKTMHSGAQWAPLTESQAKVVPAVISRLREALCILALHKIEWESFALLGLCERDGDPDLEQAAILVNRIGYEAVLLYGASKPTGPQHERTDGQNGPPYLTPPPSKTVAEVRVRLAIAITLLADVATNPTAIETLRTAPMGGGRMEAAISLQQLEGCVGVPKSIFR